MGQTRNKSVLVHIDFPKAQHAEDRDECRALLAAADAEIVAEVSGRRENPEAKYFIGKGKAEEVQQTVSDSGADLVVFNHQLTPAQERNLERLFKCRVIDRTGLILDIFAQRARTAEGKLQVELAQLQYLSTRLVRGWTHLERQKGGIGLRGPGETQLEADRRLVGERIKIIKERLEKVRRRRDQGRQSRRKADIPVISLVGYTNAGKSSLFNKLTASTVYTANQLFATLDPTLRRYSLPGIGPVVLVDTVGFIRHLPTDLVESFRATLEETEASDLLLHVVDVSAPHYQDNMKEVEQVLTQINADTVPQLLVYNKIDRCESVMPRIDRDEHGRPSRVWISVYTGVGLDMLADAMSECLAADVRLHTIKLDLGHLEAGKLRALFYKHEMVVAEEKTDDHQLSLTLRISDNELQRLQKRFPGATR